MVDYLVYRLSAALGSMGTIAGNERRGTDAWPARSALTGILGAALGVQRTDRESVERLERDYIFGIARRRLGPLLMDYHTAQTVPGAAAKRPSSRREALALGAAKGTVGTIITHREYYQTCAFDVAVCAMDKAAWPLDTLSDALLRPRYVLYFGRKACPLDLPVSPNVVAAADVIDAFDDYAERHSHDPAEESRSSDFLLDPSLVPERGWTERLIGRRDGVIDRERWLFAARDSVLTIRPEGT